MEDPEDLVPGAMVGRYRLIARLGAGGMGVVWSAQDPQLDRRVAIKVVHPSLVRSAEASERLLREARAMAKVSHRAVVTIHDAGDVDGRLFLAMELVPGTTLGQLLRDRGTAAPGDWRRWLAMMLEAGRGLAAAHREGVLHRDFKPDNVLVDPAGRVCVGDFGLAMLGETARTRASTHPRLTEAATAATTTPGALDLTTTGALVGTPGYMSPEQLQGGSVDARADQFSFCVAAYEALYGHRPFAITQPGLEALTALVEAIEAGTMRAPPPGSTVPARVREVLRRGLAAVPAQRWLDMPALLAALEDAAGLGRRRRTAAARAPWLIAAAAAAAAIVITVWIVARRADSTAAATGDARAPAPAPPPAPPAPPAVIAKRMFGVSISTQLAISPDGTRLALATDKIEIRSLTDGASWVRPLEGLQGAGHIELDAEAARFGPANQLVRWRYRDGLALDPIIPVPGTWRGTTALGELVFEDATRTSLILDGAGRVIKRLPVVSSAAVFAVAPGGKRVAFVEADRFSGRIKVWDLARDAVIASEPLVAPTAVTWLDATTLVYATGTQDLPAILRVTVGDDGFGAPVKLYDVDSGWFAELRARGDRIYAIAMNPTSRARIIEQRPEGRSVRDFDPSALAVPLGWVGPDEFLAWNRSSRLVWRQSPKASGTPTALRLDGEAANATFADELLIAALRRSDGRETVALGPDGAIRWRHGDRRTLAVRCAGDRAAPCLAIRIGTGDEPDQVVAVDPRTGELGREVLFRGEVEDLAVRGDGKRVLIAQPARGVVELELGGRVIERHEVPLVSARSVAFDPGGGVLVAGTLGRGVYQVGRVQRGTYAVLAEADNDLVLLVRPSPDGKRVLVLSRVFSPELWQLTLAR